MILKIILKRLLLQVQVIEAKVNDLYYDRRIFIKGC